MSMKNLPAIFLLLPAAAMAEVSDKLPSMSQLWAQGAVVSAVLLILIWRNIWFSILGAAAAVLFRVMSYDSLADPFVGPAIITEQGNLYVFSSYGSVALIVLGSALGCVLNRKRLRNDT